MIARKSRRAALITGLGFTLIVGVIAASMVEVSRLALQKQSLKKSIDADRKRLSDLDKAVDIKRREAARAQDQLAKTALLLATNQQEAAVQSLVQANAAQTAQNVGRIYFQIRSKDQRAAFQQCARSLLSLGYRVPPVELIPDRGPNKARLLYFRSNDRDEADRLADSLAGCVGSPVSVTLYEGQRDPALIRPRQFEVWFPPADQSASHAGL